MHPSLDDAAETTVRRSLVVVVVAAAAAAMTTTKKKKTCRAQIRLLPLARSLARPFVRFLLRSLLLPPQFVDYHDNVDNDAVAAVGAEDVFSAPQANQRVLCPSVRASERATDRADRPSVRQSVSFFCRR